MGFVLVLLLAIVVLVVFGAAIMGLLASLIWWALIGLVIGALGRLVLPGARPIGILATVLAGIGGALLGGILANALDVGSIIEFLMAVLAAAALVWGIERSRADAPA